MYALQQVLAILSWVVIGRGVFSGNYDLPWLFAWAILLFATIPLQMIVGDAQNELSMNAGAIFKQRLMSGALKLDPEEIRHQGMGQFLGRVMESEAVEMLALGGGFTAILAFIELFLAGFILARGAGGAVQVALLVVWVLLALFFLWRYYQGQPRMGGVLPGDDQRPGRGHGWSPHTPGAGRSRALAHGEDQALDRYFKLSERSTRWGSSSTRWSRAAGRWWACWGLPTHS